MPSPADPIAISPFGVEIRWYALLMVGGILAGIPLSRYLATQLGLDRDWLLDTAPWVILASILGSRAYYVLLRGDYFIHHPGDAINIRLGGMAYHGALVVGAVTFALLCWRNRQPFWRWSDAIIPGVALAQAIGRWGNWANQELWHADCPALGTLDRSARIDHSSSWRSTGSTRRSSMSRFSILPTLRSCPGSRCEYVGHICSWTETCSRSI